MYTLEDDQETSDSMRKRDFANAFTLAAASNPGESSGAPPASPPVGAAPAAAPSLVAASMPTPGTTTIGGKRTALAALTIACIAVFFTALDQTVVVTAFPQIINDLQIPFIKLDHAAWIVSAYLLGFIIMMPLMGRVSDIYGRRRIFLLCLLIFGIGSIFCGLAPFLGDNLDISFLSGLNIDLSAPGLIFLIAARFFQAIGGGALVPVAMAIASDFYGQDRRGLALGIIGAITEAGGAIGPLYGAVVVEHLGWQFIFYLNVPIVLGLFVGAWFLIPKGTRLHEGIDWIGALLLGLALTCLSLGLAQQGTDLGPPLPNSPTPQNNPLSLALAAIFLIAFILFERKRRWPVVDLSLFKRFSFSATSAVSLLVGAALIIAMADIPIFVDTVLQLPILDSGLALLRLTAMIPIGAVLGGWLCGRLSCRLTGVLGLIFTAAGFYLMSRWPVNVDWNQITVSTMVTGLGFGLVIAPIGTTAINSVKATQAGMGSATVTALRMVGMMLGLAALTSWALTYFKELAAQYQSLPATATADQFTQWSKGYAQHLINAAHIVYSSVFFTSMILCLVAILPALFLWGHKPPVAEVPDMTPAPAAAPPAEPPDIHSAVTIPALAGSAIFATADMLQDPNLDTNGTPPTPPVGDSGDGGRGGRNPRKPRRRLILVLMSIFLVLLLAGIGIFAALSWQSPDSTTGGAPTAGPGGLPATLTPTSTPIAGPRMIQLALDGGALTSLFNSQLGLQQGALSNLSVVPTPNDGLVLSLNLHIDANGIHRVMPVELDTTLSIDKQQNIQLQVQHLKRDGLDAGPTAAASMQSAINQLLLSSLMPALRGELKSVKLVSVHTSTSIGCGNGTEMLVLLIQAPPIQGIAAQPTPTAFCFKGPIDLNKLLPQ